MSGMKLLSIQNKTKKKKKKRSHKGINNRRAEKNPIWRENQKEKSKKKKRPKKTLQQFLSCRNDWLNCGWWSLIDSAKST
jgi:hypothetical protein